MMSPIEEISFFFKLNSVREIIRSIFLNMNIQWMLLIIVFINSLLHKCILYVI